VFVEHFTLLLVFAFLLLHNVHSLFSMEA